MSESAPISAIYEQMLREDAAAAELVRNRAGKFVVYAETAVEILLEAVTQYRKPGMIFEGFLVHAKKAAALALLSGLHLHRVQLNANLRQLIESSSHFAYFAHHAEIPSGWSKPGASAGEIFKANELLTKGVYKWMAQRYPEFSSDFLAYKQQLNRFTSHATILTTGVMLDFESGAFVDQFSDAWSEIDCCVALHTIGQVATLSALLVQHLQRDTQAFDVLPDLGERITSSLASGHHLREVIVQRLDNRARNESGGNVGTDHARECSQAAAN